MLDECQLQIINSIFRSFTLDFSPVIKSGYSWLAESVNYL